MTVTRLLGGLCALGLLCAGFGQAGATALGQPTIRQSTIRQSTIRQSMIRQPAPPIRASAFPEEKTGRAPTAGDGDIPNPATPTGSAVSAPTGCTVEFDASTGDTSSDVNAWISGHENTLAGPATVCLQGTFSSPIHVWNKTTTDLLEIAPAPGGSATLQLGTVDPATDVDPNEFETDAGGVSIVDSEGVEVYGLTIEDYSFEGAAQTPAGIYVAARNDVSGTDQRTVPHESACYLDGHSCGDIFLIRNTVEGIANTADENFTTKSYCNNGDVDAYGIAVISAGAAKASTAGPSLQHVVIEDNTISDTHTGESETVTLNGNIEDFLVYGNTVHDTDNIGIDTIGWEVGKKMFHQSQARHGLVADNTVYDVDTYRNSSYGTWDPTSGTCLPLPENAAGVYDDGASYIWIDHNDVWNTNQGVDVDVEEPYGETDHVLVSSNTVEDDPGTALGDPSTGRSEPPGVTGTSQVAGHAFVGLYIEEEQGNATAYDIYAHDNTIQNQSQHFLQVKVADGVRTEVPGDAPAVDLGGGGKSWHDVELWHNTFEGEDPPSGDATTTDLYNPLIEVDQQPSSNVVIDCNLYGDLTTAGRSEEGNFALPSDDWLTLGAWQAHNTHGWDADSSDDGTFERACPSSLP